MRTTGFKVKTFGLLLVLMMLAVTGYAQQGVQTLHNASASASANGGTVLVGDSAGVVVTITVAGGWDGTINFEKSLDGFTTSTVALATKESDQTQATTATAASSWYVPVAGFNQFRARISNRTQGTVTVIARVTPLLLARRSGAPVDATFITQTPNATLTNEQALSALSTGLLKSTTGTGVVSIAVAGDLPGGPYLPIAGGTMTGQLVTRAGATGANTAGIKLQSGPLNTTPEAGALEFLTDTLSFTITTGAARRTVGFLESAQTWSAVQTIPTLAGVATITGTTGNMTITAGTGNSRTMALQTTTSGGTATTFLTGNANQSLSLVGPVGIGNTSISNAQTLGDLVIDSTGTGVKQIRLGNTTAPLFLFTAESVGIASLSVGRDGTAGTFPNVNTANASVDLVTASNDGRIDFRTANSNNVQGNLRLTMRSAGPLVLSSTGVLGFGDGTNTISSTLDTAFSRDAAGIIDFGTGAQGSTAGSWKATNGTLAGTLSFTGSSSIAKYNNITTAGTGVAAIFSAPAISATKTANFTVLSYTPPATAGVYRVMGVITTTSATNTGTVQLTLDYVDSQGTTHTADVIPLVDAAGSIATTKTGASAEFHGTPWQFSINNSATAIVLKVVITGTVSYTVTGSIEQIQ